MHLVRLKVELDKVIKGNISKKASLDDDNSSSRFIFRGIQWEGISITTS